MRVHDVWWLLQENEMCLFTAYIMSLYYLCHVMSLYCLCHVYLLLMSHFFTAHVMSLYCLREVSSLPMSRLFTAGKRGMERTCHVKSLYCLCHVSLLPISCLFTAGKQGMERNIQQRAAGVDHVIALAQLHVQHPPLSITYVTSPTSHSVTFSRDSSFDYSIESRRRHVTIHQLHRVISHTRDRRQKCNTLQHTTTHCNTPSHVTRRVPALQPGVPSFTAATRRWRAEVSSRPPCWKPCFSPWKTCRFLTSWEGKRCCGYNKQQQKQVHRFATSGSALN